MTRSPRAARRGLLGALALLLASTVAGCGQASHLVSGQGLTDPPRVDTPALAQARRSAGIAPCPGARDVAGTASPAGPGSGAGATPAPAVRLDCLGGGASLSLDAVRGPVVLNGFASWCEPCRDELPLYADFARRYGAQVPVIGVDTQETSPGQAIDLARRSGVAYPLYADRYSDLASSVHRQGLPLLLMVDAQGRLVYAQGIVIRSVGELRRLVREHLGVSL